VLEQFPALLGERGLLPVPRFLRGLRFRDEPTLFRLYYSDNLLRATGWAGVLVAGALVLGFPQAGPLWLPMLAWLILWLLYLSIVNVGQRFYSFGWESLLLEAGFIAIFLGNASTAPPFLVLLLFRWLVFRVELGAGLIKLRGDSCWRDLTCMDFHHENPAHAGPLSWYFHRLPRPLTPNRGPRQLRRSAGRPVHVVSAPADRSGGSAADDRHATLSDGQRQLRVAERARIGDRIRRFT
jgi:hypothetical protein